MFELTYARNSSCTPFPVSGFALRPMTGGVSDCFALTVQRFAEGPKMILLFVYALGKRGLRQSGVGDKYFMYRALLLSIHLHKGQLRC